MCHKNPQCKRKGKEKESVKELPELGGTQEESYCERNFQEGGVVGDVRTHD